MCRSPSAAGVEHTPQPAGCLPPGKGGRGPPARVPLSTMGAELAVPGRSLPAPAMRQVAGRCICTPAPAAAVATAACGRRAATPARGLASIKVVCCACWADARHAAAVLRGAAGVHREAAAAALAGDVREAGCCWWVCVWVGVCRSRCGVARRSCRPRRPDSAQTGGAGDGAEGGLAPHLDQVGDVRGQLLRSGLGKQGGSL